MLPGFENDSTTPAGQPPETKRAPEANRSELPVGFESYLPQLQWQTSCFSAGDVVVFHERTVHASLRMGETPSQLDDSLSQSERAEVSGRRSGPRISMDTRWHVPL